MILDKDSEGSKISGKLISMSLGELGLEAHPQKTVQVVVGCEKYIENMTKELEANPTTIQQFKVSVVKSERYLGLKVCSGGVRNIVKENIKDKRMKVQGPINKIRRLARSRMMKKVGTLRCVKLLLQGQLIPILLYGTEAWLMMTKDDYKEMEDILKISICSTMSLPKNSNLEALLYEVGNYHAEAWIDSCKIKFFMKLMNIKKRGKFYRSLREEILNDLKGGFAEDVGNLCKKYRLPNAMFHFIKPKDISEATREWSLKRQFSTTILVKSIPMISCTRYKFDKEHLDSTKFSNMEARALSCFNTGNLVTKCTRPYMMRTRDKGDRSCLFVACGGVDSYHHIRYECEFYTTTYINTKTDPNKDNAKFILELDAERRTRFKTPLVVPLPIL